MMFWSPEEDETLIHRGRVSFASGRAQKVAGMRWFRDESGRDIRAELPGWPEAPVYTPLSDRTARRNTVLGGALMGTVTLVALAIEAVTGSGPGVGPGSGGGSSVDPAAEVEDFPVLVAARGTLARTLPYQLDPDRGGKLYKTELAVTDRRLVILGTDNTVEAGRTIAPEMLWEAPRDALGSVVKHGYGTNGADLSFVFTDGSRARLQVESAQTALFLAYELCPAVREVMPEIAIKKLAYRIGKTEQDEYWIAVRQDDGDVWAQKVTPLKRTNGVKRGTRIHITKWVDGPKGSAG